MFGCTRPMANNDEHKTLPGLFSYSTQLSAEWKAIATEDQRIYFVNRRTRSSHWFPPPEFWASRHGLPYGWEAALDDKSKKYYINHVTRTTTREDPRSEADQAAHLHMTPPQSRRIELVRDAKIGFGFVAGSEKPVVIRSVIPNGPSYDKLFANDQILKVNGIDVRDAAQAAVISLIKSAVGRIELEVVASEDMQDTKNQHSRKSSLMSRTTRERRRSTPVSVRFADEPALVQVIGPMEPVRRSSVPLIPNVLKVFLENGQTRSFRYDSNTTAEEIFSSFSSKLDVKLMEHFSLVLSGPKKGQVSYIQNSEKIAEIYTNRNCSSVNCLCKLNIAFVPKDHFELLSQDRNAFEYLYAQVTNRVVEGFYGIDLKYDLAIKLAALQIQQKALEAAAGRPVKIAVRQVEKEFGGLGKFVSTDLLHNMKEKELRKVLDQQIKQNENLASPGERYMSSLQCKLHYLNLAAEMFSYGGRYFDAELIDNGNSEGPSLKKTKKQHVTVLVNLKYGVSQVVRGKVNVLCQLAEFHEITGFVIRLQENNKRLLRIKLQEGKAIQLICTTLDCLDMIALITGYYKVYVDNTSNTPLPVENEEKWPFAFLREPADNEAVPDFYSRHRVVPDVWSYPSRFQTSNAKRKSQEDIYKPQQNDVFIDLSKAPPRFNETAAISEEPEEDMSPEKSNRDQTDEILSRQESMNHEDSPQRNRKRDGKDDIAETEQGGITGLVVSDEEKELLEMASSFLKDNSADSNSGNDGEEIAADNEESPATSRKRRRVSSGISGKESVIIKTAKTTLSENTEEDQEDLISELILAEAMLQEEKAGISVFDERMEQNSSAVETEGSEDYEINSEGPRTFDQVDSKQNQCEVLMENPETTSTENADSQPEDVVGCIVSSKADNDDLFACLHSKDYSMGETDVNQNVIVNSCHTKTSPLSEDDEYTKQAISDARANLHLDLSVQHDPFISTDPFRDRSPTPSPGDLGFDESRFDNKGIKLAEFLENGTKSQEHVEEESEVVQRVTVSEKESDETGSNSSMSISNSDDFELRGDPIPLKEGTSTVDLDNCEGSVASHMVSLEFNKDSDTETESAMSDEDESLWSTFPEYFQPNRRLKYSSNKEAKLSLAEEDQDVDVLDSAEPDRDVALVSVKGLSTENERSSKDAVDAGKIPDGDDWEELSTASSESLEFTYEVNAELPSESEEMSEDSGYVNFKEKNERRIGENCEQSEDKNSVPLDVSMVLLSTSKIDTCDSPVDDLSSWNDKAAKVSGHNESLATRTALPIVQDSSKNNEFAEMSKSISREKQQNTLTKSTHDNQGSNVLLKQSVLERPGILSKELPSLKDFEDKGMILDRSYSPSDWIIPPPPSPTPELQEADIRIVPAPPVSPTPGADDLGDELKQLIVPPPPSSGNTLPIISDIRIVSPPPLVASDNELDLSLGDYDDIRFLSLTDDHKLANSNVVVLSQSPDSNFTEDKKMQAQKVKGDVSLVSKQEDYVNKSIVFANRQRYLSKANQTAVNHSSASVPKSWSVDSQSFSPNSSPRCTFALDNLGTMSQRFDEDKGTTGNSQNKRVYSSDLDKSNNLKKAASLTSLSSTTQQTVSFENLSRIPPRKKPPVPPKPHIVRSATEEGRVETPIRPIGNAEVKQAPLSVDVGLSNNNISVKMSPTHRLMLQHRTQSQVQTTDENTFTSTPHSNILRSTETSAVFSSVPASSKNQSFSAGKEKSFTRNQPPLTKYSSSHLSLYETNNDLGSNISRDQNRTLSKTIMESSRLQLCTVELQEDARPLTPDTPPPPLPETSPPKLSPGFFADDFDFGEPLIDELEDDFHSASHEPTILELPSRAKDLKFKRSSASFDNKQEDCSSSFTAILEKTYDGTSLSRSSTITSLLRNTNQQFFPDSRTKQSSLGDVTATSPLEECHPKSAKTRCTNVCEESLVKVSDLKKRLEEYLNGNPSKPQQPDKAKNWPLIFQNNARFLTCDIKVISSGVKRGGPQVVSAVQTSLDSLEKLVESCEKTYLMLREKSNHTDRSLVVMTTDVLDQYRGIISTVKIATGQRSDHPDVVELVNKTDAMATLIASLIRALRKY